MKMYFFGLCYVFHTTESTYRFYIIFKHFPGFLIGAHLFNTLSLNVSWCYHLKIPVVVEKRT